MKKTMGVIKQVSVVILLLTGVISCKNSENKSVNTFTVRGTIKGLDTDFMSRSYRDENGERKSDSILVVDESFEYTAEIEQTEHIIFWPNVESTIKRTARGYYPVKSSQFAFLAAPGDEIEFRGEVTDFINAYPSGTPANEDLAEINSKVFPLMNESINIRLRINGLEEGDERALAMEDSIKWYDSLVIAHKKKFLRENPTSEAAVWYLSDMMMRSQVSESEAIDLFRAFDPQLAQFPYYKDIDMRVKGIESTRVGNLMPDFSSRETLDGSLFELSSLRGKYVLIDFWGTWCGPCIQEMPKVQEYQERYSDRLVVLGINSGDSKKKMEEYLIEQGYNWQQVMAGTGTDNLVLKFNVTGFPTKIILDPEGRITHRFLGDTNESFEVLDELLATPE